MPTKVRPLFLPLALLAGLSLVLAGCGRKGDLDVPGAPPTVKTEPGVKPKVEDRPFLLDPLL
jgi:predicted small lipoprotein YifL